MKPKLTIGMATFDDFHGVYFSIQALKLYHDLSQCELIVVDNNPGSKHGEETSRFVRHHGEKGILGARYIPMPETLGTTQTRERVFQEAQGEAVLCMDCHVLLVPGALNRLLRYYSGNPQTRDLISGPLVYDDLKNFSSHFADEWRDEMWGTWQSDERAINPDNKAFEIPGQGLGLFTCRKEAWLGFNPHFRGFGGEEMYIHTKFRQAGARAMCLPALRWVHRFGRPDGPRYPLTTFNKVRNYILGHLELGLSLERVYNHFVKGEGISDYRKGNGWKPLPEEVWQHILENPIEHSTNPEAPKQTVSNMKTFGRVQPPATVTNLDELAEWVSKNKRDLDEHVGMLRRWAEKCDHVTEFTKRRESTIALLAGRPATLVSYQTEEDELTPLAYAYAINDKEARAEGGGRVVENIKHLLRVNPLAENVEPIEETDLLYIDSVHSAEQLWQELTKHGGRVRRAFILRGTATFGEKAEGTNGLGLNHAIRKWLEEHPEWFVAYYAPNQYGMTVLSKDPADKPENPFSPWPKGYGPGTEMKGILSSLHIHPSESCDCNGKANKMDEWGVEGCREHFDEIVGWMKEGAPKWNWSDKLKAATLAVVTGLAFKLNPADPFPGIIEEAIRLAELKETK